jgi:predicted choloylglycine hydrolase
MELTFYAIEEGTPGKRWQNIYHHLEEGYRRWFLREGDAARPSYLASSRALREHMPELVPVYEQLVDLAGGGDFASRLLALWCPTPYLTGCSQAVWSGAPPLLVRNYDYHPALWDGVLLSSGWTGRRVIAMLDSQWGVLDGINEDGLSVSLAFGGRQVVGQGFGMPLILRYVLETCRNVDQGVAALIRVPSHMSYNVTLLDARGQHRTVFLAPDRPPSVTRRALATNHQRVVEWAAFAHATASMDRERYIRARLDDPSETAERFVGRFMEPPLHIGHFHHGWGTLYTSVYEPRSRSMALHWSGATLHQTIGHFQEAAIQLAFAAQSRERIQA